MKMNDKLRVFRTNLELRQCDIARLLNVSESTYQKWETGRNAPSYVDLKNIAKIYNTSMDFLCDENGYVHDVNFTYELELLGKYYPGVVQYRGGDKCPAIYDIGLRGYKKLYRCINANGEEYSAIIGKDGFEYMSCPRNKEKRMVFFWNNECTD